MPLEKTLKLLVLLFLLTIFVILPPATFSQVSESLKNQIKVLEKETQANPDDTAKLMELAKRYGWVKEQQKAIETYEKVIALDPDNIEALKSLFDFYRWNDRNEDALRVSEKLVELEPDNIDFKEKLARSYMQLGREEDAIVLFEEVVKADPSRTKTRKMLADLYSWNNRQDQALDEYLQIIDTIQVPEEKIDIYDKIADRYYGTRSYKEAKEYYERVLELDPTDEDAQAQLDKINKLRRPKVFTQFDTYDVKGGYDRIIQTAGFSKWTEDDYRISGIYRHSRRDEEGEERYRYHNWEFEISKQLNDTLTGYAGFGIKYYEVGKVRPEFFLSTRKNYPKDRLSFITAYSMEAKDSDEDELGQHVNQHSLSETMYWDINKRLSLSSTLIASYFSEGDAPDDNLGLEFYFSPTYHILLENPRLDVTYTYYKAFHARKDEPGGRDYEYYAPRRLDIHALTLYYRQKLGERWRLVLSDTIDFTDGDEFNHTIRNTGRAEVIYKINEDNEISVRFKKGKQIKNLTDDYYKDQRLTVRLTHAF